VDSIAANVNAAKTGQQQEFLSWDRYQQQVRGSKPGALLHVIFWACSVSVMRDSCFESVPHVLHCLRGQILSMQRLSLLSVHPLTSTCPCPSLMPC
jgi:hypothetical protein